MQGFVGKIYVLSITIRSLPKNDVQYAAPTSRFLTEKMQTDFGLHCDSRNMRPQPRRAKVLRDS